MRITVQLFASLRDLIGERAVEVQLPEPATVSQLLAVLGSRYPRLADRLGIVRVAINAAYVEPATALQDGDEVALIPPVSGGRDV